MEQKEGDFRKYQYLGLGFGYFNWVFAYFGVGVLCTSNVMAAIGPPSHRGGGEFENYGAKRGKFENINILEQ
jgi:hypothetical protein